MLRESLPHGSIVGVGTGSTVKIFIDVCSDFLKKHFIVSSSIDTSIYLKSAHNIHTVEIHGIDYLDVYVDGADEVSTMLDLVKGHGGALLREKILALMAKVRMYIVDYTKYTGQEYLHKPVPVEVVPFAVNYFLRFIRRTGAYEASLRTGTGRYGPVITDNGNYIVDLKPVEPIRNALKTHLELKQIHGVVETGIFPSSELVDYVIVGYHDRADVLRKKEKVM